MTELTARETLHAMRLASDVFYTLAAQTQCHAYLEFTGILNEYIKICEENLARGVDFREENVHKGNSQMVIRDYQVNYINEKLECIFQGLITVQQSEDTIHSYLHLSKNLNARELRLTNGKRLVCNDESLILTVRKEDDLFVIKAPVITLHCYASTESDLIQQIHEDLKFLWEQYSRENDDNMTGDAIELKKNLLNLFSEED